MKHAFLIIAHNNWALLNRLLKKIDHPNNDIYLHIDKKSQLEQQVIFDIETACNYSSIKFIKRNKVNWGGFSLANVELRLLEEAKKVGYDYYHIMSGIDFPTKSMEYIQRFFEENKGYEFVHFVDDKFVKDSAERYEKYHFLQEYVGRSEKGILFLLERTLLKIQRALKVTRSKKYSDIIFKMGSQWCSLTDDFVSYLLSKERMIKKLFSFSVCSDECFVQTMLYNSEFKKHIFYGNGTSDTEIQCLRSIDWKRGNPYAYQESDYDELIRSGNLFCRKVSDSELKYEKLVSKLELL